MGSSHNHSLFSLENYVKALCGAIGSATSISVLYPLEMVRTKLQVSSRENHDNNQQANNDPNLPKSTFSMLFHIYKTQGLEGLYKGWSSLVLALSMTNFVFFYTFHGLRHRQQLSSSFDGASASMDLAYSAIAGVVTVLVTNPLWVVNTRLKLQQSGKEKGESKVKVYNGIVHCFTTIIHDEGYKALWSGTTSSILLVTNPMIQFAIYEYLKRTSSDPSAVLLYLPQHIRPLIHGAVAKIVATISTYPLQLLQTLRRAGLLQDKEENDTTNTNRPLASSISDKADQAGPASSQPQHHPIRRRHSLIKLAGQANDVVKRDGLRGLFRGLESKLLQTGLNAGLMFLVYEELSSAVFFLAGIEKHQSK